MSTQRVHGQDPVGDREVHDQQLSGNAVVYVVDDEEDVLYYLQKLVESVGQEVRAFSSAQHFLDAYDPGRPGCLVLDIRMPEMSGLELQKRLLIIDPVLPVLMLTGHGEVPIARKALKRGAFDFLEKTGSPQLLLERISKAIDYNKKARLAMRDVQEIKSRLQRLTRRERQVMDLVVSGKPNKVISKHLDLSQKTVEVHRAQVMRKMNAESLPHLVRMALTVGDSMPGEPERPEIEMESEAQ